MKRKIIFKTDGTETRLDHFKKVYAFFLTIEEATIHRDLWLEQKKIFEDILSADNPEQALDDFQLLDMTTIQLAMERFEARNRGV